MCEMATVIAVFARPEGAAAAIRSLGQSGPGVHLLSIIGGSSLARETGGIEIADDRAAFAGDMAPWSGLSARLIGALAVQVTPTELVFALGPLSKLAAAHLHDAHFQDELGAIGAAMRDVGVPARGIVQCEQAQKADKLLVLVQVPPSRSDNLRSRLRGSMAMKVDVYAPPPPPLHRAAQVACV